jgi:hypothetical protein
LHLRRAKTFGVQDDREGIAAEDSICEDIRRYIASIHATSTIQVQLADAGLFQKLRVIEAPL